MLFIDETLPQIQKAKSEHLRYVKCRINKKLFNESCSDPKCAVCNSTQLVRAPSLTLQKLRHFLRHEAFLENVIDGKPVELIKISNFLWERLVPGFTWLGYEEFIRIRGISATIRTQPQKDVFTTYNDTINAFAAVFDY